MLKKFANDRLLLWTHIADARKNRGRLLFWTKIANLSERYSNDEQIRKMNGNRGSKHFLYINRTFFGLYNLLHDLKAKVEVNVYREFLG